MLLPSGSYCLTDNRTQIGLWPTPRGGLIAADAHAIKVRDCCSTVLEVTSTNVTNKTIFGSRMRFPKPVELYGVLKFFGSNIVTSEFDEWKPHRKVAAPAYSEVRGYHQQHPALLTTVRRKTISLLSRLP